MAIPRDEPPWSCKSYEQIISACHFKENKSFFMFFFFFVRSFYLFYFVLFLFIVHVLFFDRYSGVCIFSQVRLAGETEVYSYFFKSPAICAVFRTKHTGLGTW